MRRNGIVTRPRVATLVVAALLMIAPVALAHHGPPYPDGPDHDFGEDVAYPMVFPVDGTYHYRDTFDASRCCDPGEIHHAQDIMSPKMTPVVAIASGTIRYVNWSRDPDPGPPDSRCCTLTIDHDDGWSSWYIHLNNDTPGTDDGKGWGIAEGIAPGVHVSAGQLIGWVGDSGNAENTGSHLHLELRDPDGIIVDPYESLVAAEANGSVPRCGGLPATDQVTVGEPFYGTDADEIIVGTMLDDEIHGGGGDDIICGLDGFDVIYGGSGADSLYGGRDKDRIFGEAGKDLIYPGKGHDKVKAAGGRDRIFVEGTRNKIRGGGGIDWVDYSLGKTGVTVDLSVGRAAVDDLLFGIERVVGTPYDDHLIGSSEPNVLRGGAGTDHLFGNGGDDELIGGRGVDWADGGEGHDTCEAETTTSCAS